MYRKTLPAGPHPANLAFRVTIIGCLTSLTNKIFPERFKCIHFWDGFGFDNTLATASCALTWPPWSALQAIIGVAWVQASAYTLLNVTIEIWSVHRSHLWAMYHDNYNVEHTICVHMTMQHQTVRLTAGTSLAVLMPLKSCACAFASAFIDVRAGWSNRHSLLLPLPNCPPRHS